MALPGTPQAESAFIRASVAWVTVEGEKTCTGGGGAGGAGGAGGGGRGPHSSVVVPTGEAYRRMPSTYLQQQRQQCREVL